MKISETHWSAMARSQGSLGEEFDWFALDRAGSLGRFSSAGDGPIPTEIWQNQHGYEELVTVSERPSSSYSIEKVFTGAGTHQDWFEYARQGIFGFDFQDVHRTKRLQVYDLIARPQQPIQAKVLLPTLDLSWLPKLDVEFARIIQVPCTWIAKRTKQAAQTTTGMRPSVSDL